jgi:hypothetical protein
MLPLLELICIPSHWPGTGLPSLSSHVFPGTKFLEPLTTGARARHLYAKDYLAETSAGKLLRGRGCIIYMHMSIYTGPP